MNASFQSHVLLVEDEINVGSTLKERLSHEGFWVDWCQDLESVRRKIQQTNSYPMDLALLDVGLPGGDGFEIATELRKKWPEISFIFLTAFGKTEDRLRGLELGAEDYVVKPFHFRELLLRIRNALKRNRKVKDLQFESVRIGEAEIYFERFEAKVNEKVYRLTHKEVSLIKLLLHKKGEVVSRDEILDYAWSKEDYPTPRTVDNFVSKIRKLVEKHPENPKIIRSIRGIGYQLV